MEIFKMGDSEQFDLYCSLPMINTSSPLQFISYANPDPSLYALTSGQIKKPMHLWQSLALEAAQFTVCLIFRTYSVFSRDDASVLSVSPFTSSSSFFSSFTVTFCFRLNVPLIQKFRFGQRKISPLSKSRNITCTLKWG